MKKRRSQLLKLVRHAGAEGILVTNEVNVRYLTGFTGDSSYLLLTRQHALILSDPRYTEQLQEECPELETDIRQPGQNLFDSLERVVPKLGIRSLAVEADSVTLSFARNLEQRMSTVDLAPTSGLVESLREIKDADELSRIREAVRLAERTFEVIRASLRGSQTEREIASLLEHQIRLFGGQGCSFSPIVGVGPRAALPHAVVTDQQIQQAPFVLMDWGAQARGYMSDITRVLVTGKITAKLAKIYQIVLDAQQAAIDAIRPGVLMSDVDRAARGWIEEQGYGKQFGHGLGHGFGLEIHESPRIAGNIDRPLQEGMVITIEPGIYLPGWGGVRIEDDILVTAEGHEVLTSLPKQLEAMRVPI